MNKKTSFIVALAMLAIVVLVLWGRSNATSSGLPSHAGAPQSNIASALTAPEMLYDFGTISMKNGLVSHEFAVTNKTVAPVFIPTVYTSCMCTAAFLETQNGEKGPFGMEGMGYVPPANDTIAPGETQTVKVVYDPNAHGPAGVGNIDRFIYLVDSGGGVLALEIKAVATP